MIFEDIGLDPFFYPNHSEPQAITGMGGPLRYEEFQFTTKMYRLYSWA